ARRARRAGGRRHRLAEHRGTQPRIASAHEHRTDRRGTAVTPVPCATRRGRTHERRIKEQQTLSMRFITIVAAGLLATACDSTSGETAAGAGGGRGGRGGRGAAVATQTT